MKIPYNNGRILFKHDLVERKYAAKSYPVIPLRPNYKKLMRTFITDLVLQILSSVAKSECVKNKKWQVVGIAAAKARGVKFSRLEKTAPNDFGRIVRALDRRKCHLRMLWKSAIWARRPFTACCVNIGCSVTSKMQADNKIAAIKRCTIWRSNYMEYFTIFLGRVQHISTFCWCCLYI